MTPEKLRWHAGDAYNKENGEHLYAIRNGHRYSIQKTTLIPGREWSWLAVMFPHYGGEIIHGHPDNFLRDAKKRLENDFEQEIADFHKEIEANRGTDGK